SGSLSPLLVLANEAEVNGGAFYNERGNLVINRATLAYNSVPTTSVGIGNGGAVATFGTLTLADATFLSNGARLGGAIYLSSSVFFVESFTDQAACSANQAALSGGAF